MSELSLVTCFVLLMRLLVLHDVADVFVENYRKSCFRNNRIKKISSEQDPVIKRATSGSRAVPCCSIYWILFKSQYRDQGSEGEILIPTYLTQFPKI